MPRLSQENSTWFILQVTLFFILDLSKYVHNLSKRVDEVSSYDEGTFEEMR